MKVIHCKPRHKEEVIELLMQEYASNRKDAFRYYKENCKKDQLSVAVQNQKVIGIMTHDTQWSHGCNFLSYLYVHKDYRRQGVAKKLVEGFIKISKKSQKERFVYSSTDIKNKASIKFHEAMGFRICGEIDNLHFGRPEVFFCYDLKKK